MDKHSNRHHRHSWHNQEPPKERRKSPLEDMLELGRVMLGAPFVYAVDSKGVADAKEVWWTHDDRLSYSGKAIMDASGNYFIYGKSTITRGNEDYWGLKRVRFKPGTTVKSTVSTQAYRKPSDEFPPNRPGYKPPEQ